MMNFWKQRNPNNITEKPPHYRSKSDGGAVLLYLDFLTVLEGEADIVSAVSRSTPTQSQRNRIFFETVKWILSALPFFLYIWTPTCLCAIQRFHRAACALLINWWSPAVMWRPYRNNTCAGHPGWSRTDHLRVGTAGASEGRRPLCKSAASPGSADLNCKK